MRQLVFCITSACWESKCAIELYLERMFCAFGYSDLLVASLVRWRGQAHFDVLFPISLLLVHDIVSMFNVLRNDGVDGHAHSSSCESRAKEEEGGKAFKSWWLSETLADKGMR